jgi:hypothetical protein
MGVHRQIYDGEWSRDFGSGGGRVLTWRGKCGALGAVTPAIDRHTLNAELGERWLYFRFPEPDLHAQANAVLRMHSEDPADRNAALAAAVLNVFHESGIQHGMVPRILDARERLMMTNIVVAACTLTGSVSRDHHFRDIIDLPQRPGAGRMLSALTSIYLALELLGLRNSWCWKIVRKIALDCTPGLRMQFVRCAMALQGLGEPITARGVYPMLALSNGVLNRVLEDVKLLGVLTHEGGGGDEQWKVHKSIAKVVRDWENDL